jgi:photosystem II stability/assembly factor-like uncharacterized protein
MNGILFAVTSSGLYRSIDSGGLWVPVDSGLTDSNIDCIVGTPNEVYLGTYSAELLRGSGIFRSTDSGMSWTHSNSGLTNLGVRAMLMRGKAIYSGTKGSGVFTSTNQGSSWAQSSSGLRNNVVNSLLVQGDTVFSAGSYSSGIFMTTDQGTKWIPADSGLADRYILSLATSMEPNVGTKLLAGGNSGKLFMSIDNGAHWETVDTIAKGDVMALCAIGNIVLAGSQGGVFISNDYGRSWVKDTSFWSNDVWCLASQIDSVGNPVFYAGTYSADVQRKTSKDVRWGYSGLHGGHSIYALATLGNNLFAGAAQGGGVFLSTDLGNEWIARDSGLQAVTIFDFALSGENLFAATDNGVFLTRDSGTTWTAENFGLSYAGVQSIVASKTTLFAGTAYGGVWSRPLSEMIGNNSVAKKAALNPSFTSYPNPFTKATKISFTSETGYATVSIVNLLGQEVVRLFSGELAAGEHAFTWDAGGLAPGMYVCILQQGSHLDRLPVVRLR